MSDYIELTVTAENESQSDMLVAQLSNIGFEGFEEEGLLIHAFIPVSLYDEQEVHSVLNVHKLSFQTDRIAPVNWNEEWEKNFQPVIIEGFCMVRAAFHPRMADIPYDVIITPKMSFGTGHHATTYMMIQAMRDLDMNGKRVLDFGTGTGILSIFAEKMGAQQIIGIDNDPVCIENALENCQTNEAGKVTIRLRNNPGEDGVFDIILANINRNMILGNLALLRQHLAAAGVLIGSGILSADEAIIKRDAEKEGLLMTVLYIREHWMCFKLENRLN